MTSKHLQDKTNRMVAILAENQRKLAEKIRQGGWNTTTVADEKDQRIEKLKKEFEDFKQIRDEPLSRMSDHFHDLIAEREKNNLFRLKSEYVKKFTEGLSETWRLFAEILRERKELDGLSIAQFVLRLQYLE